jgi:hypothetical protein
MADAMDDFESKDKKIIDDKEAKLIVERDPRLVFD